MEMRPGKVELVRPIAASADTAFAAWTDADKLGTWFTTNAEIDAQVGGRYSTHDGDAGEYLEVEPGQKLRFTWEQSMHQPGSIVTVEFAARGANACTVRLLHDNLTAEDADDLLTGWSWALDSLKSYLETGHPIRYADWDNPRKGGGE